MASTPDSTKLYADTLEWGDASAGPRAAQAPAQAAEELRDELMKLAVIAAHQLKSPLSSIQTTLNLLLGGFVGPMPANQRELLESASRSAHQGGELVGDLLRLRGLDVVNSEDLLPVNMVEVFRTSLDRVRDQAKEKQIDISDSVDLKDKDLAWVLADSRVLREVLFVLLENAVKYTPQGGRVTARLSTPWQPFDLPEGHDSEAGQVFIEVTDTGIGVPPEAWAELFTEFYRAANARLSSRDGTGLGLTFSARAVRLMGGRLRLEPAPAGGLRARAIFPTTSPQRQNATASGPRRPVSQRVVVVGGVAAGAKAAARIARLDPDADVTVIEKGQFLSYAGCGLPYYISGAVAEQRALLSSPLGQVRDSAFFHALKNVRTMEATEAIRIDRERRSIQVRRRLDGKVLELPYDKLVLATGARAALPSIEGTKLDGVHTLHGVEDAEAIRAQLRVPNARDVVIVGGGVLGCQITESVALRGSRISLFEQGPSILGIVDSELAAHVMNHMESQGVRVTTGCSVTAIEGKGRVRAVHLSDGRRLETDLVILATGVQPRVSLAAAAGLELGDSGAVRVDSQQRSSDPDIYAVGDCAESKHLVTKAPCWTPTGSTAAREGRVAGSNICGIEQHSAPVLDSRVLKVFDWTVASTGISESQARAAGFDPVCALVSGPDRAHYLPTANPIMLKLVADRDSGRVLGMQGIGPGEVAKRIDIVATAISTGMDVDGLAQIDLAYAPPYSLALDNVTTAANVLQNKIQGLFEGISCHDLWSWMQARTPPVLLDVRLPSEYGHKRLQASLHIPLGALRGRLHEIPRGRPVVTLCKIGLRGYEAALILRHHGFQRVRVLDGGLDVWPYPLEQAP
jgi:NADPH-dependent 2,4-dienoyl-CoA reductase/sulfur reductase-like enzyme/signal transduction histidine kinase/rhodanese-related sulfurtransferase